MGWNAVLLFSKLNTIFSGYSDRLKYSYLIQVGIFQADGADISATIKAQMGRSSDVQNYL